MRRRARLAVALVLCVDRALAQGPLPATPPAAAPATPPGEARNAASPPLTVPVLAAPSDTSTSGPDSSRVSSLQFVGALADSLAARIARLAAARPRLAPDDRQVFDELLAAAREMADDGDLEGAALVTEDARQLVSKKAR